MVSLERGQGRKGIEVPLILESRVHEIKVTFASFEGCGIFRIIIKFGHPRKIIYQIKLLQNIQAYTTLYETGFGVGMKR